MDIFSLIDLAHSKGASDLHLTGSAPPMLRVNGHIQPVDDGAELSADAVFQAFLQLTTPEQRDNFHRHLELDFARTMRNGVRLRCNAAQQRGMISMAIRLLPPDIPNLDELQLPDLCKELIMKHRGLVVVTGPTGSGKSTTLAAMIEYLNNSESRRIVTIEDPVEYVHSDVKCVMTQREIGSDTLSFADALRHVLRQDPDVILVGEMRDLETASAVLTVAETGHLVLTTGHAPSTSQAIERVVDMFPPHERYLAQVRLASLLVGVLCQALVPKADGAGRMAAVEVMLANGAVRNLIREGKIYQLPNVIRTHSHDGMKLLDQALVDLYLGGLISFETTVAYCNDQNEVKKLAGKVGGQEQAKVGEQEQATVSAAKLDVETW